MAENIEIYIIRSIIVLHIFISILYFDFNL